MFAWLSLEKLSTVIVIDNLEYIYIWINEFESTIYSFERQIKSSEEECAIRNEKKKMLIAWNEKKHSEKKKKN